MKVRHFFLIAFLITIFGYILYLAIGMSSTYPAIKKYKFEISKDSLIKRLDDRINKNLGWSLEKRDSIMGREDEDCFWASLSYQDNEQDIEYRIKFCRPTFINEGDKCLELYVVGAYDYTNKTGGYKPTEEVEKLIQFLDSALLNELAKDCSH
jgi:hypothetical protein